MTDTELRQAVVAYFTALDREHDMEPWRNLQIRGIVRKRMEKARRRERIAAEKRLRDLVKGDV